MFGIIGVGAGPVGPVLARHILTHMRTHTTNTHVILTVEKVGVVVLLSWIFHTSRHFVVPC